MISKTSNKKPSKNTLRYQFVNVLFNIKNIKCQLFYSAGSAACQQQRRTIVSFRFSDVTGRAPWRRSNKIDPENTKIFVKPYKTVNVLRKIVAKVCIYIKFSIFRYACWSLHGSLDYYHNYMYNYNCMYLVQYVTKIRYFVHIAFLFFFYISIFILCFKY